MKIKKRVNDDKNIKLFIYTNLVYIHDEKMIYVCVFTCCINYLKNETYLNYT